MSNYADDLALALDLADAADQITLDRFEATDLKVEAKPDMSPVSDADTATEEALRAKIADARPADEILGEEFGGDAVTEGRQWVIDPIDGTKNFVRGVPIWATLIALLDDGVPVVGVVSAPAVGRRWHASLDSGAWRTVFGGSPKRLQVSDVSDLADSSISFSSLTGWGELGLRDQFLELLDSGWRQRAYGDFFSYCLVAEGAVDVAAEPEVSLWDLAALSVIVTEAGGTFTALDGTPGPAGGNAVATNGKLHDTVLKKLQK